MTQENLQGTPEQGINPVTEARNKFNGFLFSPEYNQGGLSLGIAGLQQALSGAEGYTPQQVFHDLHVAANQAAARAGAQQDAIGQELFQQQGASFEATFQMLTQGSKTPAAQPTPTESLSMSSAKGGAKVEKKAKPTPQGESSQATSETPPTEEPKPASPARRRGRPRKDNS